MTPFQGAFAYLQWLSREAEQHAVGLPRNDRVEATWQAVLFRVNDRKMLVPLDQVKAIVPPPRLVHIPGAKNWVMGLANMRGELTGIFDLSLFFYDQPVEITRQSVVLVAKARGFGAAFVVDRSYGIRQIYFSSERPATDQSLSAIERIASIDGEEIPVLNLESLVGSDTFMNAVA